MCAHNLVESRSTIREALQLGRAARFFSWSCFNPRVAGMEVYEIAAEGEYAPYGATAHSNAATEWVDTLLHRVAAPRLCMPGDPASVAPAGG
jgi:hypothetical protein